MNKSKKMLLTSSLAIAIPLLLQSCEDNGTSGPAETGVGGSYLFVSVPDFYFGTKDVGTSATQEIEIANRGGDVYPIRSIALKGENADEFSTDFFEEVQLNPAEALRVRVTFTPVVDGRKEAELDIDFDTIVQVSDEVNENEQNYYKAVAFEEKQQYSESLAAYDAYIDGGPVTVNKRKAIIKAPVIKEGELYGDGQDFSMYMTAINARESGNYEDAIDEINTMLFIHPDSYMADDALYLRGYIELMDKKDFKSAQESMKLLRQQHPDTSYYDTALYSEALAHQKMGNRQLARSIFEDLRYKHTGVDALGIKMAKDNLVSRMWFERANNALVELNG